MAFSLAHRRDAIRTYVSMATVPALTDHWVSLHTGDTDTTGDNELAATGGYSRVSRSFALAVGSQSRSEDTQPGDFGPNDDNFSKVIEQFGIWDSAAGGAFICGAPVDNSPILWEPGDRLNWAAGGLGVEVQGSRASPSITESFVRWYTGLGTVRPSSFYCGLHFGDPGTTGANEFSSGGYGRTGLVSWETGAAVNIVVNSTDLQTGIADPDWGETGLITHCSLWDSPVGGTYLIGGAMNPPESTPPPGEAVNIFAGELSLAIA